MDWVATMYFKHAKHIAYWIEEALPDRSCRPQSPPQFTGATYNFDTQDVSAFYRDPGITAQATIARKGKHKPDKCQFVIRVQKFITSQREEYR